MREIPSEMEFHGLLGGLANSDRSAHWAGGLNLKFRCLFKTYFIPARLKYFVSPSLYRVCVMEARFDVYMIRLLHGVRAFDGSMFRREAWVARSRLFIGACCKLMP